MPMQLILAPLRGFTDAVFRNAFVRFFGGFDRAVAPFVPTVSAPAVRDRLLRDLRPEDNRTLPVEPQLLSNRPGDFLRMAARLFDLGYETINWNLGCPFPMVAKKGRGSGLLPFPDRVDAFLEQTIPALPGRLSVKTRLGRYSAAEIDALLPIFNRYPLAELVVHPRIGVQMYEGRPDPDGFARCLAESVHPVIYNGDIRSPRTLAALRKRFPEVAGWMIGRGAVADPFLPARLRGTATPNDAAERFRRFHDHLEAAYAERLEGPGHLLGRMKSFWSYFGPSFAEGQALMKRVHRSQGMDAFRNHVNRFFDGDPVWTGCAEEETPWP